MPSLRIAEIFHSIQGEGIWVGTPSVFVRVSGCNLRCTWCDTPYASWSPEGPVMGTPEILTAIASYRCEHVVLTGGEPMLFDAIMHLAKDLQAVGHVITIETAGTVYRDLPCDLMSISPKLRNSVPTGSDWEQRHERARLDFEVLKRLVSNYSYQLKFVVTDPSDVSEIEDVLSRLPPVRPDRVLLMPEGTKAGELHARLRELVPLALERGWRLTPRLHIDLFGDTRGT